MFGYTIAVVFFLAFAILIMEIDALNDGVNIYTHKERYSFSDHLTFTIEVSEVTEPFATVYITDSNGKRSSPINIPISQQSTTITAPYSFDPLIYKAGIFYIDVEYSGYEASTEFILYESGEVVIPAWFKDVARLWIQNSISDSEFATGIEYLIQNDIITIPQTASENQKNDVTIPLWIRHNAGWWMEDLITDEDFALGLQHLIRTGIIVV